MRAGQIASARAPATLPCGVQGTSAAPGRKVARRKASGIDRMQPVDIFFRADCVNHRLLGNLFRHGKLHQNAMHLRVVVERAHLVEKRLLRVSAGRRNSSEFMPTSFVAMPLLRT